MVVQAHRQRVFFPQVSARGVDHRQPVGVGVLAEADVGPRVDHRGEHPGEVFRGRLGQMGETAVGTVAQQRHAAPQGFQQPPAENASRAMIGIEQNLELPGADAGGVDRRQDGVQMRRNRIGTVLTRAQPVVPHPGDCPVAVLPQHLVPRFGRDHAALGGNQFQPVVLGGVMAGRDLDRPGRSDRPGEHTRGWRGGDPGLDGIPSDRLQTGVDRFGKQAARGAAVAATRIAPGGARAANAAA